MSKGTMEGEYGLVKLYLNYQKQKLNSSACLLRYGSIWEDC